MKFSYYLIKKLAPGKYTKEELVEKLNLHSFEAVDLGGDVLEIAVTPNRFSDAASHLGIAREAAAIFGTRLNDPLEKKIKYGHKDQGVFRVNVKEKSLCNRYLAAYASDVKIGPSPKWLKESLETCGLRSINNVVDIMNYVMLEIGQPIHAFDADKVSGGLAVRRAKNDESIATIDNQKFNLDPDILVIADAKQPLAIAGIKGGKSSEVTAGTKRILVEAAHFESANIYLTSRKLNLRTDASVRFSHSLSPELAELGMRRALMLLQELAGAEIHPPEDVYSKKQAKRLVSFDIRKINNLIGGKLNEKQVLDSLLKLGFKKSGKSVEVPPLRIDVDNIEDLAEEAVRMSGYYNLPSLPPRLAMGVASEEDLIVLKDMVRQILIGAGYSEVYNYSLVSKQESESGPELANPISNETAALRQSLIPRLAKNLKDNSRFFNEVKVFEIGNVFSGWNGGVGETVNLGIGISSKNSFLELKGITDTLFNRLGATDYDFPDSDLENRFLKPKESLSIESDHRSIGYLGSLREGAGAVMELNLYELLNATEKEKEYEPLPKYPSIVRDVSFFAHTDARVGKILDLIQRASPKLVEDVDLIDFYEPPVPVRPLMDRSEKQEATKGLTFRIVFRADDRTLTDAEVDKEMALITKALVEKFDVELR